MKEESTGDETGAEHEVFKPTTFRVLKAELKGPSPETKVNLSIYFTNKLEKNS